MILKPLTFLLIFCGLPNHTQPSSSEKFSSFSAVAGVRALPILSPQVGFWLTFGDGATAEGVDIRLRFSDAV